MGCGTGFGARIVMSLGLSVYTGAAACGLK